MIVVDGTVRLSNTVAPTVLTDEERAANVILSCRCIAETNVVIRLMADDTLRQVAPLLWYATQRRTSVADDVTPPTAPSACRE